MAKVLLVDDEPDIELLAKQKFREQIEAGRFELLFALNGQQALTIVEQNPDIAVVVSDVNMPEMDGLTLIDRLKERSPAIKTIVVSAYGDTKTLRAAMNKGVYDFVTKPVDFKELGESIARTIDQYEPQASPLYDYQLFLAKCFPKQIDLNVAHGKQGALLWDATFLEEEEVILVMGVAMIPSPIPFDIGMASCHALLKTSLRENPGLSLEAFKDKLYALNPFLKAHVLIGHYHTNPQTFTYQTNGEPKVHHLTSEGETSVKPSQTALLDLGDIITLEMPNSTSRLSLTRIQES